MKLRPYQQQALEKAINFYQTGKVFRINACTSAGKTVMANAISKEVGKNVVFVCHTNNLKQQLKSRIQEDHVKLFNKKAPSTYHFYTYQSLVKETKKNLPAIDLLVIDEAHQGGLSKKKKLGSYNKILKTLKPKKILVLSATDYGLDEDIFGKKTEENTFLFSYRDAMNYNVLNDLDLMTIHTGLEQFISSGDIIEDDDLDGVMEKDIEKGVDLRADESRYALMNGLLSSTAETYLTKECDPAKGVFPQAVFFVKNIDHAERLKRILSDRLKWHMAKNPKMKPSLNDFVRLSHSRDKELSGNINDFRDGKFSCLINVRQVQEGFDYPKLELIFDCAPSFSNNRRVFRQRLGRCIRKHEGKKRGRYYILHKLGLSTKKYDGTKVAQDSLDVIDPRAAEVRDEHIGVMVEGLGAIESDGEEVDYGSVEVGSDSLGAPEEIPVNGAYDEVEDALKKDMPKKIYVSHGRLIINKVEGEREINRYGWFDLVRECEGPWNELKTAVEFVEWIRGQEWFNGCEKISDWQKRHPASYQIALKKLGIQREVAEMLGWSVRGAEEFFSFTTASEFADWIRGQEWFNGCEKISDWQKMHQASYAKALQLGIQREIAEMLGWSVRGDGEWNSFTTASEFAEWIKKEKEIFKGCDGLTEWRNRHGASYRKACQLGIQREIAEELGWEMKGGDEFFSFTKTSQFVWWIKKEKEIFKGCDGLTEWSKRHQASYEKARQLGIQREVAEELGWNVKGSGEWNSFTTVSQFVGWIKKEKEIFKGCSKLREWEKRHQASYQRACQLGVQREIAEELGWETREGANQKNRESQEFAILTFFQKHKKWPPRKTQEGLWLNKYLSPRTLNHNLIQKCLKLDPNNPRFLEKLNKSKKRKQNDK